MGQADDQFEDTPLDDVVRLCPKQDKGARSVAHLACTKAYVHFGALHISRLHSQFEAGLDYMKLCIKQKPRKYTIPISQLNLCICPSIR